MEQNTANTQSGTVESDGAIYSELSKTNVSDAEFEQFLALLNTRDRADENSDQEGQGKELFTQSDADIGGTPYVAGTTIVNDGRAV